jgi:hypothetical protein
MTTPEQTTQTKADTTAFLYANAVLLRLYRARVISRKVYEIAKQKCAKKLNV